ncbi:MAG: GGDEF domain-containing protein [Anaerolineaceae bacterium]|nr:GGDEF domain-containing protein [Anaerolineaceae bacterium]
MKRTTGFIQKLGFSDLNKYRSYLAKFYCLIGVFGSFIIGIIEIINGNNLEGFSTLGMCLSFMIIYPFIDKVNDKKKIYRIGIIASILNFSYAAYVDAAFHISGLWLFVLPIPITLLFGIIEGALWVFLAFIATLIAIRVSPNWEMVESEFFSNYILTFFSIGIFASFSEWIRKEVIKLYQKTEVELHKTNHELYESSIRDTLTGFYNRTFMGEPLEKLIAQSVRAKNPLVFILIDLDNFKKVNDEFGHLMGDEVLVLISQKIQNLIKRRSDFVLRYGGDEFLIVLPDTSISNAKGFALEIREAISRVIVPGTDIAVKASIGLAELPLDFPDDYLSSDRIITTLISAADKNLYTAKSMGGNTIIV